MGRTRHTRKRHTRRKRKKKRTRRRRRTRRRTRRGGDQLLSSIGGGQRGGTLSVKLMGGLREGLATFLGTRGGGGKKFHFAISDKAPGDKRGMASDRRKANKFLEAAKRKSRKHKRRRRKRRKR